MNASELYANLDDDSKDQLRALADEITARYEKGPREGTPQGRVILFLGASANYHAPAGFEPAYGKSDRPPLTSELNQLIIDEIFDDQARRQAMSQEHLPLSYIAQYYEEQTARRNLIEKLSTYLDNKRPSPILKALAEMNFKYVISTNYDNLFEEALLSVGKSYSKGTYKANKASTPVPTDNFPQSAISIEKPFLYKFHGDIREAVNEDGIYVGQGDSIVITDDDYLNFILRMSQINDNKEKGTDGAVYDFYPIPQVINEAFTGINQNTFLFVGYGLQDYNLRLIFKTTVWSKDKNTFNALRKWSITLDRHQPIQQYWTSNFRFTFICNDIWTAIPYLYKLIFDKEMPL